MGKLDELLRSVSRQGPGARRSAGRRALALMLCAMLALGGISAGAALAAEADSEGEGGAPPGAAPEVEEAPGFEPGGEETALEELPEIAGEGEAGEGEGEGPPVEAEPEAELPPAAEEATGAVTGAAGIAVAPSAGEVRGAEAPVYESAPADSGAPVERQALSAPESPPAPTPAQHTQGTEQARTEAPPPAPAPEQPRPQTPQASATPVEPAGPVRSLAGHRFHVVSAGECLWSIAKAMLPGGASNAAIAREVERLWRLNAGRIGTGDPSLLMVGTRLRLA
jgi:hypothetical protein